MRRCVVFLSWPGSHITLYVYKFYSLPLSPLSGNVTDITCRDARHGILCIRPQLLQ